MALWLYGFMANNDLAELESKIGIKFKNQDLLSQALTHRSYINENPDWHLDHNERLEFLGDAVLELVVTEYLYNKFPDPEGELTSWRAALVNAIILARISSKIDLDSFLLLSRGEAKDIGRARQYILANAMESLIGAIYLDRGYDTCKEFIEKFILGELPAILEEGAHKDYKSRLQEQAQERIGITPTYEVLREWGPDHAKSFHIGVYLGQELVGEGNGPSKQDAQQVAAKDGLEKKGW